MDMKHSVIKPLSARWIISAYDYLRTEAGIVHGGFVEAGICEALDEAQGDCDSEGDPSADIMNSSMYYLSVWYNIHLPNHINLVSVCVSPHYLNKH